MVIFCKQTQTKFRYSLSTVSPIKPVKHI